MLLSLKKHGLLALNKQTYRAFVEYLLKPIPISTFIDVKFASCVVCLTTSYVAQLSACNCKLEATIQPFIRITY